jgi:two-component system, LytTR family, response regulator
MNENHTGYTDEAQTPLIALHTSKGTIKIPVQQIIRIQSLSNYSKLFFNNGKSLVVAKVLHLFEEHPRLSSFVRIHRKHLVNISYIKTYPDNKTGMLLLDNGETIGVARRKKRSIAERLNSLNNTLAVEPTISSPFSTKKILAA